MIQKVEMYQAVCDGCGHKLAAHKTQDIAIKIAKLIFDWQEIDGKLYCPDCVEYDEETDSYKPKEQNSYGRNIQRKIYGL